MNLHQNILSGIKELLFLNNYLVVPGFGGFVLKKQAAHLSPGGGSILPPSKSVSFNAQLKQNDGVLLHWIQSNLKCSQDEATQHLTDFAEYCRSVLLHKGRLNLQGIGFFYTDAENNINFEPQTNINFLKSSFGLDPVRLVELEPLVQAVKSTEHTDRILSQVASGDTSTASAAIPRNYKKYRSMALATVSGIVLLSALLFVVSNSQIRGRVMASITGEEIKTNYTPLPYTSIELNNISSSRADYVADANGVASVRLNENTTIYVQAEEAKPESTLVNTNSYKKKVDIHEGDFEIVLGCFSIEENAHRMVNKLSSLQINAYISGKNEKGLFVVSGGGFVSKEAAVTRLQSLKESVSNAWIRKKN